MQVPKGEAMRESTVFVSNLGDDKVFLQTQGDHQKLRHKSSKNKSNSLWYKVACDKEDLKLIRFHDGMVATFDMTEQRHFGYCLWN